MKTFHKVLAVILSLVMLLSVVPVAVFAAESGSGTQSGTESSPNSGLVSPGPNMGTGEDGTITLKLNASDLVAALKGEKSLEELKALLRDVFDRSEADALTKADLMELIPVDGIFQALMQNIDPATLSEVMGEVLLVVDRQDLIDFALDLPTNALNEDAITRFMEEKLTAFREGFDSSAPDYSAIQGYFNREVNLDFLQSLQDGTYSLTLDDVKLNVIFAELGDITTVVNVDVLGPENYLELAKLVGVRNLIDILANDAEELVSKEQLKDVLEIVLFDFAINTKLISVNGYDIAVGEPDKLVSFNFENAVRAIASLIPSLTEWAECEDGKIFSFNLKIDYNNNAGREFNKDLNVEVVLEGDLTNFRKLASRLSDYIAVYNKGNVLYVDVTMPEIITRAFAKFLESDRGNSIKDEILNLGDATGEELVDKIKNLTLEQIIALVERVDIEELYNIAASTILDIAKVELALEKIQEELGLDYNLESLEDLNKILDKVANTEKTFEEVVNAISARINVDIMKYLEKGAAYADNHDLISKLEQIPYIGGYVTKYKSYLDFTDILNAFEGEALVEKISSTLANHIGGNLQHFLQTHTANEVYDRFVEEVAERAEEHKDIFERIKNYVLAALNPEYEANSDWGKLVQTLIPDKFYNLLDNSIADAYKGNGKFEVGDHSMDIDLGFWSEKAIEFLFNYVSVGDTLESLIKGFLPTSTVNFGVNFSLTMRGLYRVRFMNSDGLVDKIMFLPRGLNPANYYHPGEDFTYWVNNSGERVDAITADVDLYVYNEFIEDDFIIGGILRNDGNGNWTVISDSEDGRFVIYIDLEKATIFANAKTLTFANEKGLKIKMELDASTKVKLFGSDAKWLKVSYDYSTTDNPTVSGSNETGVAYTYTPDRIEKFGVELTNGDRLEGTYEPLVDTNYDVTVPHISDGKTSVYQVEGDETNGYTIADEEFKVVSISTSGVIVFKTTHFSDYIVVNEYSISTIYTKQEETLAIVEHGFLPAGAKMMSNPQYSESGKKAIITSATYNGENAYRTEIQISANVTTIECTVDYVTGTIYYFVLGEFKGSFKTPVEDEILEDWKAEAAEAGKIPEGYTTRWVFSVENINNADRDVYVSLVLVGGTTTQPDGYTGEITYNVYDAEGNVIATLASGTNLKTHADTADKIIGKIIINMLNGAIIEETNGEIRMPDFHVMVKDPETVTEVTYTINGKEFTAVLGSTASFEVLLNKNQELDKHPNIGTLASYVEKEDGSKILTYTFIVEENLSIEYTVKNIEPVVNQIAPAPVVQEEKTSLLWLWILLTLIVLIGLIALFYNLYINGKLKPNFMLRFITWIVSMFFKACLAISAVVLWIAQGTTKKGEVDYEEFGMSNPENLDENATEETAEETTENDDNTVAALEEVAEENFAIDEAIAEEAVAEEATEEVVAEEATEEVVAEETAEEVVAEETAEEVVAEETAEEVVAEEATEEVVAEEAAEEVVAEEAAEEVVAEEAAEEVVAEEAAEEVVAEEATEEVVAEEAAEEVVTEEAAEEVVAEEATEEVVAEEATEEVVAEETATEATDDQN